MVRKHTWGTKTLNHLSTNTCHHVVENEPHEGKRVVESTWPVFRIHHQRTRYIYDLYYKRKAISRELYDYLLKNKYADANLIAKWKKVRGREALTGAELCG